MTNLQRAWYCIHTRIGSEPAAAGRLTSRSLETLTPLYHYRRSNGHGGYDKPKPRAFYPGYFFTFCSLEDYQLAAYGMPKALLRLVSFSDGPQLMSEVVMDEIRDRMDTEGYIETPDEYAARMTLEKGQFVSVVDGPYKGFEGLFDRDEKRRVIVLMNCFGGMREIPMQREWLRPIAAIVA